MKRVAPKGIIEPDFISGYLDYSDSPGYEWQSLWIFNWSLILTTAGAGEVIFDDGVIPLPKGGLILIKPNLSHRFQTGSNGWELLWLHFLMRPHMARELIWNEEYPGVRVARLTGAEFRRARVAMQEADQLHLRQTRNWHLLAYTLVESVLWRGADAASRPREGDIRSPILKAQELLLDFQSDFTIDQIAATCGFSRAVFYSRFRAMVGIAPREYRELHAMRHAQRLLQTTALPVAEIARQCGIENAFYFSARFRKFIGCSPSEYRNQCWPEDCRIV